MSRRLLPFVVVVLAAAPAALADGGPSPPALQNGSGVRAPGGGVRYVAVPSGFYTVVQAQRAHLGTVLRSGRVRGSFGIPSVTFGSSAAGLSRDGSRLVLAPTGFGNPLRKRTTFVLLSTANLRVLSRIDLRGDFSYDALSPDASKLYLIQHVSRRDLTRYVVRAYDVDLGRLLPGRIADRTQRGWVMAGYPLTRTTSADGRWVYTLYQNSGDGYPFVHALDTVRGVAHCIGIPWHGDQNALWQLRMSLRDGGRTLNLHWRSGREYLAVARGTWRISHPSAVRAARSGAGFPWWTVALGTALGAALLVGAARLRSYGLRARAATN